MRYLDDGSVAVVNANPFGDFTGGSLLTFHPDALPAGEGRALVSALDPQAVDLPSFGAKAAAIDGGRTLVIPSRYSGDGRTREVMDDVWFVDVSDPSAPALDERWGDGGASLPVGYDPNAVVYDPDSAIAYVVNRTGHDLTLLDVSAAPAVSLPPGGPGRLTPDAFVDADDSGSRATFVSLEATDPAVIEDQHWSLEWNVATVRAWVADGEGVSRVTGNGEDLWVRSGTEYDFDVEGSGGAFEAVREPNFFLGDDDRAWMTFTDQGAIKVAFAGNLGDGETSLVTWAAAAEPLLEGSVDGWDTAVGGPALVEADDAYYLFYDGGDGDGRAIGVAVSVDGGATFVRRPEPVLDPAEGGYESPFVFFDGQAERWRMFFTVVDGDAWSIGQAWSDDLLTWTESAERFAPAGGAASPALGYYGGRFHLFYVTRALRPEVWEATSVDGLDWQVEGPAFALGTLAAGQRPRIALQSVPEGNFSLVDPEGQPLPTLLTAGGELVDATNGWKVRVAVGQGLDPEDVGEAAEGGVELGAIHDGEAFLTFLDADGVGTIGVASVGEGRALTVDDPAPILAPFADWNADGVTSPVVAEVDGERVMWFAGEADGVLRIGRAVEGPSGWTPDPSPVFEPLDDWESLGVVPSSAFVAEDGTLHLFYTGSDGDNYRVGEATSTDGVSFTRVPGVNDPWTFEAGPSGDWHDGGVRDAFVRRVDGVDQMWFAGFDGGNWQIGQAQRTDAGWDVSDDAAGTPRPVLRLPDAVFGRGGLLRPVVADDGGRDVLWYTGFDGGVGRVGAARLDAPDRAWRDLRLPSLADTWGFTSIPEDDAERLSLDIEYASGAELTALGCADLTVDPERGFVYVACTLSPYVYVVDVRDDSDGVFLDLNYLDLEAVLFLETATNASGSTRPGMRQLLVDPERDWLWGLAWYPESVVAFDLARIEDDADIDQVNAGIVAMLPLPSRSRDEGVDTGEAVGPGQMVLHPDGRHLFVTNFNDNSLAVYDLGAGAPATLVGLTDALGENPYALAISPDGTQVVVANYLGEVVDDAAQGSLVFLDADPDSPTFLDPLTWVVNR